MRCVKLYVACSLDGYIARADGSLDWLASPDEEDYGYEAFMASVDTLVMGRRTYDVSVELGGASYYGEREVLVLSRTRAGTADDGAVYVAEDPRRLVERLRAVEGKDIWLMGGGEAVRAFLADSLIDEIEIFVHPILLGDGVLLFPAGFPSTELETLGARTFSNGLVQLSFRRA